MRDDGGRHEHEAPVSWSDEMTWQEDDYLLETAKQYEHSAAATWALWALGGAFGLHRLYLRRPGGALVLGPALAAALVWARGRARLRALSVALLAALWVLEGVSVPRLLREDTARAERRVQGTQDAYRAGQERERAEDEHENVRASTM